MQIKYLEERTRAGGKSVWIVNPPRAVRDALGVGYEQFEVRQDAVRRASQVADAYQAHKRGQERSIRIAEDSVEGLIAFYKSTNEWRKLKPNSVSFYSLMFRSSCELRLGQSNVNFGGMIARNITPTHADKIFTTLKSKVSEHRAVSVIKVLRKVWFVGKRHGKVQINPFERMGLQGLPSRTVMWEPEQVDKFIAKADEMGLQSVGTIVMLAYHMCQRPGDMRQLKWENYSDGTFDFYQEKTGVHVQIPASDMLQERLALHSAVQVDPEQTIVLCETTGRGYDRYLYTKYAKRIRDAAGLPSHLQVRDLRRTGATEMAEAGATEDELRAVTGHLSRDILSIYVRPTKKLAVSGVNKRFARG